MEIKCIVENIVVLRRAIVDILMSKKDIGESKLDRCSRRYWCSKVVEEDQLPMVTISSLGIPDLRARDEAMERNETRFSFVERWKSFLSPALEWCKY